VLAPLGLTVPFNVAELVDTEVAELVVTVGIVMGESEVEKVPSLP